MKLTRAIDEINKEIDNAGGRIKLASIIMNENSGWFTYTEHLDIRTKLSKIAYGVKKKKERKHHTFWKAKDTRYLVQNWGILKSSEVAKHLGRSQTSCRQKFQRLVGEVEYKKRIKEGRYSFIAQGKRDNTKIGTKKNNFIKI